MPSYGKRPIGVVVPCWDTLRRDELVFNRFMDCCKKYSDKGIIILSQENTAASATILRAYFPKSIVVDTSVLSIVRLFRLANHIYHFTDGGLQLLPRHDVPIPASVPRFGLVVSNGFGLGHVMRMGAIANALAPYGNIAIMSFSAGLRQSERWPVFYLPSAEYLKLHREESLIYTKEATRRFIEQFSPTHLLYDGNVLPSGMLSAIATRPDIHLTWVRRGMWQTDIDPRFMAQQALVDLVVEPGDLADKYDTGPTWNRRDAFVQPPRFMKTPPIPPDRPQMDKVSACKALNLPSEERYALLMLGTSPSMDMESLLVEVVQQVKSSGVYPIIAHWPIAHQETPHIEGATVIERMPIAPYYGAFDFIISAAGYNSYHELLASGLPIIFMPQEDKGRDQQLARARFAADNGWARLCRQQDVSTLHVHIEAISNSVCALPSNLSWLTDWKPIIQALCGKVKPLHAQTQHILSPEPQCDSAEFFHTLFTRYGKHHTPFDARFILLSHENELALLAPLLSEPGIQNVILTDSVNPILLRRKGLAYLWLNRAWLPTRQAMIRQFLCWLMLWRPKEMVYCVDGQERRIRLDKI